MQAQRGLANLVCIYLLWGESEKAEMQKRKKVRQYICMYRKKTKKIKVKKKKKRVWLRDKRPADEHSTPLRFLWIQGLWRQRDRTKRLAPGTLVAVTGVTD